MTGFSRYARFLLVPALLGAAPAFASGSASGQFNVTATVLSACSVTAADLLFGNYSASAATPDDVSSALSITCTSGLPYTVALDGGTTAANVAARTMTDGASHSLKYFLYTNTGRTTLWGDATAGTATVAGTGSGSAQGLTVYGRVNAGQYVVGGSCSDKVTVTINY